MTTKTTAIGNAYIALARTVTLLNDPTRTRRVASAREFLRLSDALVPPFCVWVFDGEGFSPPKVMQESGAIQQTEQHWSAYVGAMSFGPAGEGAFDEVAGAGAGEDAETLTELLVGAVQGIGVYGPDADGIVSRAYPVRVQLEDVEQTNVIYRVTFRNPFVRLV